MTTRIAELRPLLVSRRYLPATNLWYLDMNIGKERGLTIAPVDPGNDWGLHTLARTLSLGSLGAVNLKTGPVNRDIRSA
jgi:hypothetical protein